MSAEMNARPILVFDSGVGGLSICQSLRKAGIRLPLLYVADTAWFPYGLREEADLLQRVQQLMEPLIRQHRPSLVILACNTLSTLALPTLRAQFDVPFVGVVPAIKPAARQTQSGVIGLLATPATVKRPYTDQLIAEFAPHCEVLRVGSNELVLAAEHYFNTGQIDLDAIEHAIQPLIQAKQDKGLDTVVLGCTHFPLLVTQLDQLLPGIQWIDSGDAIARRVKTLLTDQSLDDGDASLTLTFTGAGAQAPGLPQALARLGFESSSVVEN
jgi:glutamate racemase